MANRRINSSGLNPESKRIGLASSNADSSAGVLELHPVFCLKCIEPKWGLSKCTKDQKVALLTTLHELSQMTWSQILHAPRHGKGSEKIAVSSSKAPIPPQLKDIGDIQWRAFRCFGLAPFVGYRDHMHKGLFHIVWLDTNFQLYNH